MAELFIAEFRRKWIEFLRYPTEIAVTVIVLVMLFHGLFIGATYISGHESPVGQRLDGIIVGYVVWAMTLNSVGSIANEIVRDTQVGVLEQVLMSVYGPISVFMCRAVVDVLLSLIVVLAVLFPILLLTGRWLTFSVTAIVPLGAIILGTLGIAFLMGAAAFQFKKVQQFVALGQFLLLFVVVVPLEALIDTGQVVRLIIPLVTGVALLRDQLAGGHALDWVNVIGAYGSGALYAAIGFIVFQWSARKAKRNGKLGWY